MEVTKISNLIDKLESIKKEHGDLSVIAKGSQWFDEVSISELREPMVVLTKVIETAEDGKKFFSFVTDEWAAKNSGESEKYDGKAVFLVGGKYNQYE